jgi:ATP-dependent Clp protease ATP-binding subunit ClpA
LLGILDKATLTLGDNRRVDLSQCIIILTSNLGASEMTNLVDGGFGFAPKAVEVDNNFDDKIQRTAVEAARRKFTPEFMNRLDKIVTFQPLGSEELKKILDIELNLVQQRIFNTSNNRAFVFTVSDSSKDFLLEEGTDLKYGARHLKRAIERLLVQPMSNLIATDQVRGGDWIRVDYSDSTRALRFTREAEGMPVQDMARLVDTSVTIPAAAFANGAVAESPKTQAAKISKRS